MNDNRKKQIQREYLTVTQLSEYSGISKRTLWDFLKNPINPIPHFRVGAAGRIVRVKRSDFDQWMETQRADQKTDVDQIVDGILN